MALFAEDSFDLPTDPRVIDPGGAPLPPLRRTDRDLTADQDTSPSTTPAAEPTTPSQRPPLTLVRPPQATVTDTVEDRPHLTAVAASSPTLETEPVGASASTPPAPAAEAVQEDEAAAVHPPAVDFQPGTEIRVPSGTKARLLANIAVIDTLMRLKNEGRPATATEQQTLACWSGWGAVAEVFDTRSDTYAEQREYLQQVLGHRQYRAASASTLNAHYTDPAIAEHMWKAVQHAGFSGGRVLEPGCGSGTFIGLAPDNAQMVGVEKDPISAAVAAHLYPSAQIRSEGFETTNVPNGSFAAVIGNVPFGDFALRDPAYNPKRLSIHNHFIVKSLDLTAPGGYVVVLTSRYTMDNVDDKARREIFSRADLLGAVRLPTSAFRRVAGTDVVTDILVLRRREADREIAAGEDAWLQVADMDLLTGDNDWSSLPINTYFHEHPEHMLGTPMIGHGIHGSTTLQVRTLDPSAVPDQVARCLRRIIDTAVEQGRGLTATADSLTEVTEVSFDPGLLTKATAGQLPAYGTLRYNAAADRFESWDRDKWVEAKVFQSRKDETIELLKLRDAANAVVASQRNGLPPQEREQLRGELNRLYDAYVKRHGPIQRFKWSTPGEITQDQHDKKLSKKIETWRKKNPDAQRVPEELLEQWDQEAWEAPSPYKLRPHIVTALRNDPSWTTVLALESYDEQTKEVRKAPIFSVDLLGPPVVRDRAETAEEALAISLDQHGGVDVDHIAALLGTDRDAAREHLRGLVFPSLRDPEVLIPATTALSGNVRRALRQAEKAAETDARYQEYAEALRRVQPVDKQASQISARPGSPWIHPRYIAQFARETFAPSEHKMPRVKVDHIQGVWTIECPNEDRAHASFFETWGTRFDNRDAIDLLEMVCNQKEIVVKYTAEETERTGRTGVNRDATVAVQAKATKITEAFQKWIFADEARRDELVAVYNERFNSLRAPKYSGAALSLPGLSTRFEPHPYQRDAVARIIAEPNVLLDHVVGAGKSGTMFMAAMELRRLGLARQPWIVVPNHIIEQVGKEAKWWYPSAEILLGTPGTNPEGRRRFVAQSATSDWDMVIVPQSLFEAIPVGPDVQRDYIERELEILREALSATNDETTPTSVKRLEKALQRYETKLKDLTDQAKKDTGLRFEMSGADYLLIDEAHMFKNRTRLSAVRELACPNGSERADDLAMKMDMLRIRRREEAIAVGRQPTAADERVATFATGTPVANSLGEMYVMQRYLRPDLLEDAGVFHLNDWGAAFTSTINTVEVNATGTQLKPVTRVGKFTNLQELLKLSSVFTDVITRNQVLDQANIELPELVGGKRTIVNIPADQELKDFIIDLGYRASAIDPKNMARDNILKISNDGREASLDPRMVHLPAPAYSRTAAVADQIMAVHTATADRVYRDPQHGHEMSNPGALQIVFCDRGTPTKKAGKPKGSFNMYSAIRDELIERGMPADRIRFIHDAEKAEDRLRLFDECNKGLVSVLIGSTEKMGTGTNVQTRALALHHVDVPWRPADLEQREGRIIRQGNQNREVHIFNYVVEGSYDTVMWQKIEAKSLFIEQVKRADIAVDEVEDVGGGDLSASAAETKAIATGDPRYVRQVQLQDQIDQLAALERSHHETLVSRDREIAAAQRKLGILANDLQTLAPTAEDVAGRDPDARPTIVVEGRTHPERKDTAEAFASVCRNTYHALKNAPGYEYRPLNVSINGVALVARREHINDKLWIKAEVPSAEVEITVMDLHSSAATLDDSGGAKARGLLTRAENLYKDLPKHYERLQRNHDRLSEEIEDLQATEVEPFDRGEELAALREEHATLTTMLRLEAESEEAKARAAESAHRMRLSGREPGWSLHLNPTPFLLEQSGFDTAEQYRFAQKIAERARAADYLASLQEQGQRDNDEGLAL
ncbi:helicase [Mycobacterium sp. SWH-M5]|nr:helicase [Mycobacterium sp. SWH-M5]